MNVGFPFIVDARGRTATADDDAHVRQLIEQVLFTSPGERVNRPDFGSGVLQLLFAPASDTLSATARLTAEASLQTWLGSIIEVQSVTVMNADATLNLEVQYVVRRTRERRVATFQREG